MVFPELSAVPPLPTRHLDAAMSLQQDWLSKKPRQALPSGSGHWLVPSLWTLRSARSFSICTGAHTAPRWEWHTANIWGACQFPGAPAGHLSSCHPRLAQLELQGGVIEPLPWKPSKPVLCECEWDTRVTSPRGQLQLPTLWPESLNHPEIVCTERGGQGCAAPGSISGHT